ncbi:helix-turn-helix domain-containing protein [Alteromonas sp. 5E99-2]|uniref:ATP-binding protein n=1 Tax=Alteromonas sp. 5E99-2 TaxID=2817683 RepID=UPI001A97FF4F|nr:ATP-binding protein [Alteromonas sp. 5E99-2]MBO1254778.1 helix-turn-helix domain-containing protein [Alteromonas sp. 5E99-2]
MFEIVRNLFFFTVLISFVSISEVKCDERFVINGINEKSIGLIGAAAEFNGTIYLGAENGFYQVNGDVVQKLDLNDSLLKGGYVSAIFPTETKLYLTIYGKGVFEYDLLDSQFKKLQIDHPFEQYAWSIAVSEKKLIVSYVTNVLVLDLNTYEVQNSYLAETYTQSASSAFLKVSSDKNYAYTASETGLLVINLSNGAAEYYKINDLFPKLTAIDSFIITNDHLLVAGQEGLYKYSKDFSNYDFLSFSEKPNQAISALMVDINNIVWLAAGGLYKEKAGSLIETDLLSPHLGASEISIVSDLFQFSDGRIFISSSQKGLISLPNTKSSIKYISLNNVEFPNTLLSLSNLDSEVAVVSSYDGYYALSLESGSLSMIRKFRLEESNLLNLNGQILDVSHCSFLIRDTQQNWKLNFKNKHKYCSKGSRTWSDNSYQLVFYSLADKFYIDIFDLDGKFVDSRQVPSDIYIAKLMGNSNLVAVSLDQELLVESKGIWNRRPLDFDSKLEFPCVEAYQNSLYVCTSGYGLQHAKMALEEPLIEVKTNLNSDFIRDIKIVDEHLLIVSNKGMELYDMISASSYFVGKNYGIFDRDFNFSGLNFIGNNKLIVRGDNSTYLLESSSFIHEVKSHLLQPKEIKFLYIDVDGVINRAISFVKNSLIVSSEFDTLRAYVAINEAGNENSYDFEYKVDDSDWVTMVGSHGLIDLSDLGYGSHKLLVRSKPKNGISSPSNNELNFTIQYPFYLTQTAKLLYLLSFILLMVAAVSGVRKYRAFRISENEQRVKTNLSSLKNSSEMMEKALKSKAEAITRISHEVRTPLMLITEPLKQIAEKVSNPDILNDISLIERNASRVSSLIDQLLELERLGNLREISIHHYDIEESCIYLIESIRPLAEQKSQRFKLKLKAKGEIYLIQDTLQQVFYNLLSNAIKYSENGEEIRIDTFIDSDVLIINIKDNGPGFTEQEQKDIFERFMRLDNAKNEQGVGLGLSLLRQLIKANSGYIEVASKVGSGACFTVRLPLKLNLENEFAATPKIAKYQETASLLNTQPVDKELPPLLIVEDNIELQTRLKDLFKDTFLCFSAKNASEALRIARTVMPKIMISDHSMQGMTGLELIEVLRNDPIHEHMIIYMCSALRDSNIVRQAHDLKVEDFILKPFDFNLFKQKVVNRYTALNTSANSVDTVSSFFLGLTPKLESEKDQQFYLNLKDCLAAKYSDSEFTRENCANALFVSERQLNRKLKMILNLSFSEVIKQYRIDIAKQLLNEGKNVTDTAYDCGFNNPSYFSTAFKSEVGMAPSEYIKR